MLQHKAELDLLDLLDLFSSRKVDGTQEALQLDSTFFFLFKSSKSSKSSKEQPPQQLHALDLGY